MSRRCFICDKKAVVGNSVSHSNRKTKRLFKPNLQKVRMLVKGKKLREYVCTKCLKAGKVTKSLARA
ncbi:MAG: 50S ribosomal protein L28 [Candidatus Margulisiibacteriota bacterium]